MTGETLPAPMPIEQELPLLLLYSGDDPAYQQRTLERAANELAHLRAANGAGTAFVVCLDAEIKRLTDANRKTLDQLRVAEVLLSEINQEAAEKTLKLEKMESDIATARRYFQAILGAPGPDGVSFAVMRRFLLQTNYMDVEETPAGTPEQQTAQTQSALGG